MRKGFLTFLFVLMVALALSGVALGNTADVYQIGDDNQAYIEQIGDGNKAFIEQHGDDNGSETSGVDGITFEIDDETDTITITSPIFETFSYTQYQNGNHNTADTDILGSFNNTSQWQDGDDNTATIEITGYNNIAKQVQVGEGNRAVIDIEGNRNIAYQYHRGNFYDATITIDGNDFSVYMDWSGSETRP